MGRWPVCMCMRACVRACARVCVLLMLLEVRNGYGITMCVSLVLRRLKSEMFSDSLGSKAVWVVLMGT